MKFIYKKNLKKTLTQLDRHSSAPLIRCAAAEAQSDAGSAYTQPHRNAFVHKYVGNRIIVSK